MTNARGIRSRAVAEHAIAMLLAHHRRLPMAMREQGQHRWRPATIDAAGPRTLAGKRLLVIGLGSVGLALVQLAHGMGLRVSAVRRHPELPLPSWVQVSWLDAVVGPERMRDLLPQTDAIVLCAPATRHTRHLLDEHTLAAVKPGALLINVARGTLVDDVAVVAALRMGRLGGAGLDVFTTEPLRRDSPYWDLDNVIVTPHVAGSMEDVWTPLTDLFADNLRRHWAGEPLVNVVDKRAGY